MSEPKLQIKTTREIWARGYPKPLNWNSQCVSVDSLKSWATTERERLEQENDRILQQVNEDQLVSDSHTQKAIIRSLHYNDAKIQMLKELLGLLEAKHE